MMIHIYWADLNVLQEFYDEKVNMLHASRADKLKNYKMPADRIRSLGAGLLLEKGLEDYLGEDLPKDDCGRAVIHYSYGAHGKPYLKDYPDVHFSLSHSGNMAVLALAGSEVGIDVQEKREVSDKVAKRFYHEEEKKLLECTASAEVKEALFYQLWTGKEAYIKYTGEGMARNLHDFAVDPVGGHILVEGKTVAFYTLIDLEIKDYYCSIVFDKKTTEISKIIKINL